MKEKLRRANCSMYCSQYDYVIVLSDVVISCDCSTNFVSMCLRTYLISFQISSSGVQNMLGLKTS